MLLATGPWCAVHFPDLCSPPFFVFHYNLLLLKNFKCKGNCRHLSTWLGFLFSTLSPVELEHKAQTEQSILTPHKEQCHSNRRLFTVYDNKGAVELFLPFYRSAPFFHSSQSPVLIVIEMAALWGGEVVTQGHWVLGHITPCISEGSRVYGLCAPHWAWRT